MSTETTEAAIRADERARCVAELRTYSDELMASAVNQVIAGDDNNGFGAVRFASSMARASQLLESGQLTLTTAPALSVSSGEAESRG